MVSPALKGYVLNHSFTIPAWVEGGKDELVMGVIVLSTTWIDCNGTSGAAAPGDCAGVMASVTPGDRVGSEVHLNQC